MPLSAIYGIVFCDQEAMDGWWPAFVSALPASGPVPQRRTATKDSHFRLPKHYAVTARSRPSRDGEDQLHLDAPFDGWVRQPHWMDLDDQLEELETLRADQRAEQVSWADFYDDGQPDDPDWYERSIKD